MQQSNVTFMDGIIHFIQYEEIRNYLQRIFKNNKNRERTHLVQHCTKFSMPSEKRFLADRLATGALRPSLFAL